MKPVVGVKAAINGLKIDRISGKVGIILQICNKIKFHSLKTDCHSGRRTPHESSLCEYGHVPWQPKRLNLDGDTCIFFQSSACGVVKRFFQPLRVWPICFRSAKGQWTASKFGHHQRYREDQAQHPQSVVTSSCGKPFTLISLHYLAGSVWCKPKFQWTSRTGHSKILLKHKWPFLFWKFPVYSRWKLWGNISDDANIWFQGKSRIQTEAFLNSPGYIFTYVASWRGPKPPEPPESTSEAQHNESVLLIAGLSSTTNKGKFTHFQADHHLKNTKRLPLKCQVRFCIVEENTPRQSLDFHRAKKTHVLLGKLLCHWKSMVSLPGIVHVPRVRVN